MRPDLSIERASGFPGSRGQPPAAVAVEIEPTTVPVAILEEVRETYLEILRRPDRSLVAVIELPLARQQGRAGLRPVSRQA